MAPLVRREVRQYLVACTNLLAQLEGSHEQFMDASRALQQKTGLYTDDEIALVQDMVHRVSAMKSAK